MGNLHAADAANLVTEGLIGLRQAVAMNLQSNHFPPIPTEYVAPTVAAIEACNTGDPDAEIDITVVKATGKTPRLAQEGEDGTLTIAASSLIEITHSWHFVEQDDEWFEDEED